MPLEDIKEGMEISSSQTITDEDIASFANASGDKNPIHVDEEYIKKSRFKKKMAHDMMSASRFSALFGTKIPRAGCLYVSQNLRFKKPVYVGDTVVSTAIVTRVDLKSRKISFKIICKVRKRIVIGGEAEIYVPPNKDK